MDWTGDNDVLYALGLGKNSVLTRLSAPLLERARQLYNHQQSKVRLFGEFSYQAGTWRVPRRVIVKVEVTAQGENLRYVVINMADAQPKAAYEDIYSARGQAENYIKGHRLYLRSDRTSCHRFQANQLRLFLHSAFSCLCIAAHHAA